MLIQTDSVATTDIPSVRVLYSPNLEIASSLHLLSTLPRTAWPAWAAGHRDAFDASKAEEFTWLSEMTENWTLVMDLICSLELSDISDTESFLGELEEIDDVDFAYGLFSGIVSRDELREVLGHSDSLETWTNLRFESFYGDEFGRAIIGDLPEIKDRLSDFLLWYWNTIYSQVWTKIGVQEMWGVGSERKILNALGPRRYLEGVHPQLAVGDDVIHVIGDDRRTYGYKDLNGIDVYLSAYVGKELMLTCVDGRFTVYKGVDVEAEDPTVASDQLLLFLKAISSKTKLDILCELNQEPKTTKELSESLGIAPSSASGHLKTLREAELIYPQREQNAVYNRFLKENFRAFVGYLGGYFD